jgi:TPR repeat protein
MFNYGVCLRNGQGVAQDLVQGAHYFKMAADHSDASGMFNYGLCLTNAQGVERDFLTAAHYYNLSATHGDAMGMANFGGSALSGHAEIWPQVELRRRN